MDFLIGIEPREYQTEIFKKCVEKNCLVVLSTGMGKTLIALMVAIERMKRFPGQKVVFLAPTRPLAEQHLKYFEKHLPELFADMQIFTGKIHAPERKKIWKTADIIFSTPQCIANDIEKSLYNLEEVCLLIEDEAHRCMKNYDYNIVAKRYMEQSSEPRILGLTASPGSEKSRIKEICRNLFIEEVELRGRESEDVKPYMQSVEFRKEMVDFPKEFEEIRVSLSGLFNSYVNELKERKVLFAMPSKSVLIGLQKKIMASIAGGNRNFNYLLASSACAQAIKVQHALELLETQTLKSFSKYLKKLLDDAEQNKSRGVKKLVSKPEFTMAFIRSKNLLEGSIEHPKISSLSMLVKEEIGMNSKAKIMVFTQFRDTASIVSEELNKIPGVMSEIFVGQTKKIGAGEEGGTTGLNQKEQGKVISRFSSGELNVICSTSIGEEGLDIPEVSTVIFYEPIPSAIRAIQRAGRTARLAKGKIIVLITKKTRDEAFFYVSKAREKSMHEAIDSIKRDFSLGKKEKEFQEKLT